MAEEKITQEQLQRILNDHALWVENVGRKGKRASLLGANLLGANLLGANLIFANLAGANLTGVDFGSASLGGTNLRGADLRGAALDGAKLWGVEFDRVRCNGVMLFETVLTNMELTSLVNSNVKHSGPSTIDYRSIAKSLKCANLEQFLVAAGMSHMLVTYTMNCIRVLDPNRLFNLMNSTFISYGGPIPSPEPRG